MRNRFISERGSVSIEAALALSSVILVAAMIIAAMATLTAHIAAWDVAGAAGRAHALGVDYEPSRGEVFVSESNGIITVIARVPAPLGVAEAEAKFPVEQP